MPERQALSEAEQQVVTWMRWLATQSPEWKLTLTKHQRQGGGYLQVEPTPYLKVALTKDAFLAVE